MIVYGVCAGPSGKFDQYAGPSIERVRGADDVVVVLRHQISIFDAYNEILTHAATLSGVEAVVLMHDDVELRGSQVPTAIRTVMGDDVGVVGAVGGRGHTLMGWWSSPDRFGKAPDTKTENDFGGGTHDVDTVDGLFLALSPWTVRSLRFDSKQFDGFHAYDADICAQARAAGMRVVVTDLDLFHHRSDNFYGDKVAYHRSALRWQIKWRKGSMLQRVKWRARLATLR